MSPFEYLLPLVSVLVGLAIADLAVSLHRLLRAHRRVRWDWLPLATALLAVLAVLEIWWLLYAAQDATFFTTLGSFLLFAAQLIVLFLNAAALPDDVPAEGLNLRAFYEANGPYFWSLYAAYIVLIIAFRVGAYIGSGLPEGTSVVGAVAHLIPNLVLLALFVVLARVRRRRLHAVVVLLMIALLLAEWGGLRLEAS